MHCAVAILQYDNRHPMKTDLSFVRSTTISAASALIVIGCPCRKHGQAGSFAPIDDSVGADEQKTSIFISGPA